MKLVDANVLLYSVNADTQRHEVSVAWLERCLGGDATVGFTWLVLLAFVRLSTKANIFPRPLSSAEAFEQVESWLSAPNAVTVEPTAHHASIMRELLNVTGTAGNLTSDAHLAALAIEHRGSVVSYDHDFARFPGVTWEQPTASTGS